MKENFKKSLKQLFGVLLMAVCVLGLVFCMKGAEKVSADTDMKAWVEYTDNGNGEEGTLTFYYNNEYVSGDNSWEVPRYSNEGADIPWRSDSVTKVVFDGSFSYYKPEDTSYWFESCSNLTTIEGLTNLDTSEVTNMNAMFGDCYSLTSLNFGNNFNTSNVTNMNSMFSSCTSLQSLNFGNNFNTSNVTNMRSMFYYCTELTSLDLGENFNTSIVTDMNFMFYNCCNLKTIYATDSFKTENVADCTNMFSCCSRLVGGNGTTYSSSNVGIDFARIDNHGCSGYFTDRKKAWVGYTDNGNGEVTLTFSYNCPAYDAFTGNKWEVFDGNTDWNEVSDSVTKVVFDASFAGYKPKDTSNWFNNFCNLTTIEGLTNLDTSEVTNMACMFAYCSSLTSLDLGAGFNTSNVTNMNSMFHWCSSLTSLKLGTTIRFFRYTAKPLAVCLTI